ncbi:MAG: PqqD family protein [Chloroflexi bacterium]|nr:PqqD family protein [Chloroflexota bacterium]
MSSLYPAGRRDQLVVEHVKDEVLVYDLERDQASCLNTTAALVWKYADGKTSVSEIADKMSRELGMLVDVRVVWYALEQLGKKHLLQERIAIPVEYSRMTRRDFLTKAGIVGAAVAIPVVIALAAPTPAMAATCTGACTGGPGVQGTCVAGCICNGDPGVCV